VVIKGGNRWLGQEARDFFYDGQQQTYVFAKSTASINGYPLTKFAPIAEAKEQPAPSMVWALEVCGMKDY
jgi:hypothetical protein